MSIRKEYERILRAAGELAQNMHKNVRTHRKGNLDFVTSADIAVQEYITEQLSNSFPGVPIIGEEDGASEEGKIDYSDFFVIDPIDGTSSYMMPNSQRWGITFAQIENGRPSSGATYLPNTDILISAVRGEGTFVNESPVTLARKDAKLDSGLCAVEIGPWLARQEWYFPFLQEFSSQTMGINAYCSAVWATYELLQENILVYLNLVEVRIWDVATAVLAIEEAGGVALSPEGNPLNFDSFSANAIIGASPYAVDKAVTILSHYI